MFTGLCDKLFNGVSITEFCCVVKLECQKHPVVGSVPSRARRQSPRECFDVSFIVDPDPRVDFQVHPFLGVGSSVLITVLSRRTPNNLISRVEDRYTRRSHTVGLSSFGRSVLPLSF